MSDEIRAITTSTIDAINTMIKASSDEGYYLGFNAHTGRYRIWGDVIDTHYATRLYAVLMFEDDHLCIGFAFCNYRKVNYNDPDYLTVVLALLHPGSTLLAEPDN